MVQRVFISQITPRDGGGEEEIGLGRSHVERVGKLCLLRPAIEHSTESTEHWIDHDDDRYPYGRSPPPNG